MDETAVTIDGRGLTCAMLTARVWREFPRIQVGGTADIVTTNPGSEKDVPAQVKNLGSEVIEAKILDKPGVVNSKKYDKEYHYYIRRLR